MNPVVAEAAFSKCHADRNLDLCNFSFREKCSVVRIQRTLLHNAALRSAQIWLGSKCVAHAGEAGCLRLMQSD